MKNLKRALSLVLSVAMLAGMMMVSTGAAFADVKAEHNEEAIAVVSAAGIMGANKEFNPDANITRNEMAVVMCNMLGLETADFAGASNFTDVPAWAADYVDACYANGIVSGVSATQYNGGANVTTAEAALMMLKALGYFEYKGINDWMLDTIKQASKIDLLDGIDAKATAKLTRNEVAQLCLNALEANTVEESTNGSNTSIKGESFEITVDAAVDTDDELDTDFDYNGKGDAEQLIEKLFEDRFTKTESGKTNLGLPAIVWEDTKEDETIIKAAKEATKIIAATKDISALDLYVDKVDEDFDAEEKTMDADFAEANAGDVVYFYKDKNGNVEAYKVVYELVQIKKIHTDMTKKELDKGYSFEVELKNGEFWYDTDFAGFDYEKDDYVLVAYSTDGKKIADSALAESMEGKVKSVNSKGKVNVDGDNYDNLSGTTLTARDEFTALLNKAGQIIKVTELNEAVKSDDFAYIYNVVENDNAKNEDGVKNAVSYTAYVVLADGTKASYIVEEDSAEDYAIDEDYTGVVPYSINSDKELVIEASDYEVKFADDAVLVDKAGKKSVTFGEDKVYATTKTEFVFASWNDKGTKLTATVATGIENVDIAGDIYVIYDADDDKALYVFVMAEDEGVESDTTYAVMIDNNYSWTDDEDGNDYFTYTVFVDGEETTMVFEKAQDFENGETFAYFMDGDYAVEDDSELKAGTVNYEGDGFIEIDGEEYTINDDADVYTITKDIDLDDTVTFYGKNGGAVEKDAEVEFVANDKNEISLIFVRVTKE